MPTRSTVTARSSASSAAPSCAAAGEPPGRLIARSAEELADLLDAVDVEYRVGSPPSEVSVLTHDGARVPEWPERGRCRRRRRCRFGRMAATSATSSSSSREATPGCRSTSIAVTPPLRSPISSASRSSAIGGRERLSASVLLRRRVEGPRATGTRDSASATRLWWKPMTPCAVSIVPGTMPPIWRRPRNTSVSSPVASRSVASSVGAPPHGCTRHRDDPPADRDTLV